MCGLVGVAGDTQLKYKDVFTDLLYIDTLRGNHSTGAAIVRRDGDEILLEKAPMPGYAFIGTKEYKKLMETFAVKVMIGHNRYATIGAKTTANAHPFQFENVVGAHNGTIDKFAQAELKDHAKFGTDSEAIYNSINEIGLKKTIAKLTGAWALTFFDKTNNTMNLLRNSKRPLFYAFSDDMETLMWTSEAEMLAWIIQRHNIKLADNKIYECEPDVHYRWTLPVKFGDKLSKPVVAQVEGFKGTYAPPVSNNNHHYTSDVEYERAYGGYWPLGAEDYGDDAPPATVTQQNFSFPEKKSEQTAATTNRHDPPSRTKLAAKLSPKVKTKGFRPPYKDHLCKIINKIQFTALVKTGCVYCEVKEQEWGDFIKILRPDLDGRRIYLCEDCYNTDDIRELVESSIP